MEVLDRKFRPGFWRLSVPVLTLVLAWLFFSALVSTEFAADRPWIAEAVGVAFGAMIVIVPLAFVLALASRLYLFCEDSTFDISVRIGPIHLFHGSTSGRSWHAIATPGHSCEDGDFTSYRVEVATESGERIRVLGPLLCWFYRVECL